MIKADDLRVDDEPLWDADVAQYRWGRYVISLSPQASIEAGSFLFNALAQILAGAADWKTRQDFLAFVAICHEFVHYQQDLCTGLGHWDYVARKAFIKSVKEEARQRSLHARHKFPLPKKDAIRLLKRFAKESTFNQYRRRHIKDSRGIVSAVKGCTIISDEGIEHISLASLLELEAVLSVARLISSLKTTDEGRAMVNDCQSMWRPMVMSLKYSEPFISFLQVFSEMIGADSLEQSIRPSLDAMYDVLPSLLDIAFSYPPPDYFNPRPNDRIHFEPSVRLLRMISVLHKLAYDPRSTVVESLDEMTRHTPQYSYPSMQSIYAGWTNYFEGSESDPIAALRFDLCKQRCMGKSAIEKRSLAGVLSHDLPIFYGNAQLEGETKLLVTKPLFIDKGALYASITGVRFDLALVEWFLGAATSGYRCPKADTHWCQVSELRCQSGISRLSNLPMNDGCSVRTALVEEGFDCAVKS